MDNSQTIIDMINKLSAGDNTAAQDDFNTLLSAKLQNALDNKKHEIAQSIYAVKQEEPTEEPVEDESTN